MPAVSDVSLRRAFAANAFPVPKDGFLLLGLRGALPEGEAAQMDRVHHLTLETPDYVHPRCTLGIWNVATGDVALFPGTTVPHSRYVRSARERNGRGANQLLEGRFTGYAKGHHKGGTATGHRALRQMVAMPLRRTADDIDFDNDDRVEIGHPYDNIHAMWSMGPEHDYYASAGCQGACGYPACKQRGKRPAAGPWAEFDRILWGSSQTEFVYHLLPGRELARVMDLYMPSAPVSLRLRYGSQGEHVEAIQRALKLKADGDFGAATLKAVLDFQEAEFGANADDGVVGPITGAALGLAWPKV